MLQKHNINLALLQKQIQEMWLYFRNTRNVVLLWKCNGKMTPFKKYFNRNVALLQKHTTEMCIYFGNAMEKLFYLRKISTEMQLYFRNTHNINVALLQRETNEIWLYFRNTQNKCGFTLETNNINVALLQKHTTARQHLPTTIKITSLLC